MVDYPNTTIAAALEAHLMRELPFDFGLELRGQTVTGDYRVTIYCDGLEPADMLVAYRYFQAHPRLTGLAQVKDRFTFYAHREWVEKVVANHERR